MDSLALREDRLFRGETFRTRSYQPGRERPRLPTPETSRSSLEDCERGYQTEYTSRDATVDDRFNRAYGFPQKSSSQLDCRIQVGPRSPPYEELDVYRPSLPPLKTVLGDSMSSPPRTPQIVSAGSQPIPREPTYTTDIYKPPSLYPNKKQKREPLEPVPNFGSVSFISTNPTVFQSPVGTKGPSNMFIPAPQHQHQPDVSRPFSSQRLGPVCRTRSPTRSTSRTAQTVRCDISTINGPLTLSNRQYETTEQQPVSAQSECNPNPTSQNGADTKNYQSNVRRYSTNGVDGYRLRYAEELEDGSVAQRNGRQFLSPTLEDFRTREGLQHVGRVEQDLHRPSEFVRDSYQHTRPPDGFVPGSYEYYYTKARKRSNLPKHSTEIMRAWFDQNITNPYPSEDQKAVFANATGISLTQVSNWFINHRRRCPELRDKRVERKKP